jgi:anti-anti-sigma factor
VVAVRTERLSEDGVVVWVSGDIDLATAEDLTEGVQRALAGTIPRHVVVDLSGTRFLDSSGVRALLQARADAAAAGAALSVRHPQELVELVLRTTRVDAVLGLPPPDGPSAR